MLSLFVLRHAKAKESAASGNDRDRPLSKRGEQDARAMGKAFRPWSTEVRSVLCSPAIRALQTAEIFVPAARLSATIAFNDIIYAGDAKDLLRVVKDHPVDDAILLIGHNPALELLCAKILGAGDESLSLATCALAHIDFPKVRAWKAVEPGMGVLRFLLTPKPFSGS